MRFFIILLTCLMLGSCGEEPFDIYVLRNETSHVLNIKAFSSRNYLDGTVNILKAEEINIDPLSEYNVKRTTGEYFDNRDYFSEDLIDSIRIIFDAEKLLILTCKFVEYDESCHPIFRGDIEFSITEEDYENAVPIE